MIIIYKKKLNLKSEKFQYNGNFIKNNTEPERQQQHSSNSSSETMENPEPRPEAPCRDHFDYDYDGNMQWQNAMASYQWTIASWRERERVRKERVAKAIASRKME